MDLVILISLNKRSKLGLIFGTCTLCEAGSLAVIEQIAFLMTLKPALY